MGRKSRTKALSRRGRDFRRAAPQPRVSTPGPTRATFGKQAGGAASDSVGRLRTLVARQSAAQQAVEAEILRLLSAGLSWTDIGAGVGLTRQGARQRYRRLLEK
jgi:hypothetical protein